MSPKPTHHPSGNKMKLRNLFLTLLAARFHTTVIFANDAAYESTWITADESNGYSFKILSSSSYTDEN
ncbi:MAG: hypothetical protein ACI9P7_000621 [Candidatus Azotimanducaceae bacterium]|jgi:hypothetical protein